MGRARLQPKKRGQVASLIVLLHEKRQHQSDCSIEMVTSLHYIIIYETATSLAQGIGQRAPVSGIWKVQDNISSSLSQLYHATLLKPGHYH